MMRRRDDRNHDRTPLHGLASDEEVLHRVVDKLAQRFAASSPPRPSTGTSSSPTPPWLAPRGSTAFLVPRTERFALDRLTGASVIAFGVLS
jgi:hypothetical protein